MFLVYTYALTQAVQIRGIIMTATAAAYTSVVAYARFAPHEKRTKKLRNKKYVKVVNMLTVDKTFIGACSYQLIYILQEMQAAGNIILAGPDGSFGTVVARNSEVLVSNPGPVGCV